MSKKDIVDKLKREVAAMPQFDLKCAVCQKKFGKYFVFHHKKYITGDKIYSDFKHTYAYNEYVLPIIKKTQIDLPYFVKNIIKLLRC